MNFMKKVLLKDISKSWHIKRIVKHWKQRKIYQIYILIVASKSETFQIWREKEVIKKKNELRRIKKKKLNIENQVKNLVKKKKAVMGKISTFEKETKELSKDVETETDNGEEKK